MFVGPPLRRCFTSRNACIVNEDIDPAVPRDELIRDLGNARGIRHIHGDELGVVAFRGETGAAGRGRLRVAIRNHDFRSRFRERLRTGEPDALPGAGYDRGFSVQPEFFQIHFPVLPVYLRMTSPSLSKRCRRAGSGTSQTRSPALRLNSPMQRAVSIPSLPAST